MSNEWQPIETAPQGNSIIWKDGRHEYATYILAWPVYGQVARVHWWQCRDKEGAFDCGNFLEDGGNACRPTHWMPLPEPPE